MSVLHLQSIEMDYGVILTFALSKKAIAHESSLGADLERAKGIEPS